MNNKVIEKIIGEIINIIDYDDILYSNYYIYNDKDIEFVLNFVHSNKPAELRCTFNIIKNDSIEIVTATGIYYGSGFKDESGKIKVEAVKNSQDILSMKLFLEEETIEKLFELKGEGFIEISRKKILK